jgi:hypothetical protein
MKSIHLLILITALIAGCEGQGQKTTAALGTLPDTSKKKQSIPGDIIVNKRFDDKGNLIQYDSTYSYHYSSPGLSPDSIASDSLYGELKGPLKLDYQRVFGSRMDSLFFNDTLFKYDFYNSDYFSKRFQLNMLKFEEMFREMDSLKLKMMENTYPRGNIKKN